MTHMEKAVGPVLKADALGRVKTPPDRREQLLEEFERSGLSGSKFAQVVGIKYQTFAAWVARRRKQRGGPSSPTRAVDPVRWLEAVVTDAQGSASKAGVTVKVQLPGGARMELSDPNQVTLAAALLHALGKTLPEC